MQEHLTGQLAVEIDDPIDRLIGVHLIDMLDEAGYLTGDLAQVAELLGCPIERVEAVLLRLQEFDPTGVFARSLAECLALQLEERDRLDAPMRVLLAHLDLVGRRDWPALCRLCGVTPEALAQCVAEIRTLNPKPALVFDYAMAQPVTPDVIMRPHHDGGWMVELNSDTLPRVLVNNHYYAQVSRSVRNREDKQYINECLQSANWLVKSLHQRATTILKVATEIIRQQQEFFVDGVQSLRPLVLRDIAEAIEHAREHGQPRHLEQVRLDAARHLRAEVLLHPRHRRRQRRRCPLGEVGPPSPEEDDRRRGAGCDPVGRRARRSSAEGRHRHRPPDRRQVSRGDAHPVVGATPAAQGAFPVSATRET